MPELDFTQIDDVQDFSPLPEGTYQCRLAEVGETATKKGDEMWRLRFEVAKGEHAGRYVFDNVVFSGAAQSRVKLICASLGLDVSRKLSLTPSMLHGRACLVRVVTEEYVDEKGNTKTRNKVPFAGYEPLVAEQHDAEEDRPPENDSRMPF